jgi:hypothetical protein
VRICIELEIDNTFGGDHIPTVDGNHITGVTSEAYEALAGSLSWIVKPGYFIKVRPIKKKGVK